MTETITDRWGVSRPKTLADTIREKSAAIPKIDVTTGKALPVEQQPVPVQAAATVHGRPYQAPTPTVPELGDSIVRVAQEMRVDPLALLADEPFATGIIGHDPTDLEGLGEAIAASGVRPAMRPNRAQGSSGQPQPAAPETPAQKIARATTNSTTGGAVTRII